MCPDIDIVPVINEASSSDVNMMSALSLAFVGDSVYDLMIRSYILSNGDARAEMLHKLATKYANASFQAAAAQKLADILTEEELAVYKRGRNAHSAHTPKNKSESEYHKATGFEALLGYLYLKGRKDRLKELFEFILNTEKEDETENEKEDSPFDIFAKRK